MTLEYGDRLLVVSPHLDDAVFSLGATIARAATRGADVRVLTVLANDPAATAPAPAWERACGFRTAGEAAEARRAEDERACRVVSATPAWLAFGDREHGRGATDATIKAALAEQLEWASLMLVPGYPLAHADHVWLAALLLRPPLPPARIGLYVEQPYAANAAARRLVRRLPRRALPWEVATARASAVPQVVAPTPAAWWRKQRAIAQYESQLRHPYLRLARARIALFEAVRGGEGIAWVPPSGRAALVERRPVSTIETASAPRRGERSQRAESGERFASRLR